MIKFGPDEVELSASPSEYFRRHCYIATEPDEPSLRNVIEELGADNIIFASDYPHRDGLFPEALNQLLNQPIGDETKAKIVWHNPGRLYGLATPDP